MHLLTDLDKSELLLEGMVFACVVDHVGSDLLATLVPHAASINAELTLRPRAAVSTTTSSTWQHSPP